jgi:hypothetical protein
MKRIILFLSLLLFLGLGATAQTQTLATTTFSTANGNLPNVGANFAVPVDVTNIGNIFTLTIYINYDPEVISYTGSQNPLVTGITVTNIATNVMKILVGNFPAPTNVPDGTLIELLFDFLGGDSELTFRTTTHAPTWVSNILLTDYTVFEFTDADVTNGGVYGGYVANTITSGTWGTATDWSLGVVPNSYHNVTVDDAKGIVTIDADAIANDVTIADGGQLTHNAATTLTVGGNFLINSGGSFIQNGTLSVTGTTGAERYIAAANWIINLDGWHFLSSPVANQAISGAFTPSGPDGDYDFYRWYEPTYTWQNQKVPAHGITTFVIGKGYLVAYEQAGTKTFSGIFNTTDKTWDNLTRTNTLSNMGWNLIGNPYPCALEWGDWSLTNISTLAKVWGEASAAYIDINPAGIVPAMNGLMVQVTTVGVGSLTIPAADRTHNTTPWYKSEDQRILLVAHDLDYGEVAQQSVVRFNEAATEGYDSEFDCYFLEGYAPVFYSVAEGKYLSTNTLPEWSTELIVPFMFEKNGSSNFMIELAETIEGYDVFLKDLKENITVNLTEMTNYAFTSEEGDDPERFEILFGVVGIDDIDALAAAYVYSYNNKIIIANVMGATNMDVINIQGQAVYNLSFNSTGFKEIAIDLPSGIYLVRLSNSGEIKTSKVFVK